MINNKKEYAKSKFAPTGQSLVEIIEGLKTAQKQKDAYELVDLFERVNEHEPLVWYPAIIGFGQYTYKYDSGRQGESPLLAFSPRQAKISLYLDQDLPGRDELLARLGKHKLATGCVYVNKLADIDLEVLEEILVESLAHVKEKIKKYDEM